MSKATNFEVTIAPQLANTGTIEHVIRESLDALIGFEASVLVTQKDDRTLAVTIIEKVHLS